MGRSGQKKPWKKLVAYIRKLQTPYVYLTEEFRGENVKRAIYTRREGEREIVYMHGKKFFSIVFFTIATILPFMCLSRYLFRVQKIFGLFSVSLEYNKNDRKYVVCLLYIMCVFVKGYIIDGVYYIADTTTPDVAVL